MPEIIKPSFFEKKFEKTKGELKSVEIADVGKIEYKERFIELSKTRRKELKGLVGFKIKDILSLPDSLQNLVRQYEKELSSYFIEAREYHDRPEVFLEALLHVGYLLRHHGDRSIERLSEEALTKIFSIEYELTEHSAPSWGIAQHGLMGDIIDAATGQGFIYHGELIERVKDLRRRSLLFTHYHLPLRGWEAARFRDMGNNVFYLGSTKRPSDALLEQFSARPFTTAGGVTYYVDKKNWRIDKTKKVFQEIEKADYVLSCIYTSTPSDAPQGTWYHLNPFVINYGNKNRLFRAYLESILDTCKHDPKFRTMLETCFYISSKQDKSRKKPLKESGYPSVSLFPPQANKILEKEGGIYITDDLLSKLKLLLQRKPFIDSNLTIPITNYPSIPKFELAAMAESIIDFTNLRVIMPMTEE